VRQALGLSDSEEIEWVSPVASDDFAEYYDQAFLERLGVTAAYRPLADFWPPSGPRWDGLARTSSGKVLLVEAKAYVEEAVDYRSDAGEESLERIHKALAEAKADFKARDAANWQEPFYQYANRLAHLYFARTLNHLDAYLLFVDFANAPDVPTPCTEQEWRGAVRVIEKALGLGAHPYRTYVRHLVLSVPEMLAGNARLPD
jgi:hypothetical protein